VAIAWLVAWALFLAGVLLLGGCARSGPQAVPAGEDFDPPEQTIGERLFLETRFAEYFAVNMQDVNKPLAVGDPVVNQAQNLNGGPMAGPFAGLSINCRTCHFVDEFQGMPHAGNRTYADFTDHSPIPRELNGFLQTPRNAPREFQGMSINPNDVAALSAFLASPPEDYH